MVQAPTAGQRPDFTALTGIRPTFSHVLGRVVGIWCDLTRSRHAAGWRVLGRCPARAGAGHGQGADGGAGGVAPADESEIAAGLAAKSAEFAASGNRVYLPLAD